MSEEPIPASHEEHHLVLRNLQHQDYQDIAEIMDLVYPTLDGAWSMAQFEAQLARFPEGQIGIEDNGRIVAAAISLIVDYDRWGDHHSYREITGNGFLTSHSPTGDVLYGVDVFVHPEYRDMRLGRRLYDARKELCRKLNLRAIVAGGRIPGYVKYADQMSPEQYIEEVIRNELRDPILSFQLANGFHVRRVIRGYMPDDEESQACATLVEWSNIAHQTKATPLIGANKSRARVGTVQWQMRPLSSVEDVITQVEFFIDALGGYQCDFALLPEFFNAALMAQFNQNNPAQAVRGLASFTEPLVERISELAVSYNINVIAGSMPVYQPEGHLYNVSYLCRRDGTIDHQQKLHITPDERAYWGMRGGDRLRVFDTDAGRIAVLICYDVEFPELSRILSEQGVQILFVPYWTDTRTGYLRVRHCAQARAIENECYVVVTGSVGNLPRVENMDVQYSQSAVFTPSDFAFDRDAIAAEATPNTEMTLVVDLDLTKLADLRDAGSVRNYKDRRRDLYRVAWDGPQLDGVG
ncbi:MAG: bifunctional GNAT family N-acetyltransferase/carbon-nitrogen hydrolase family protein [Pseudomonadota bacterium]|nr:bifunctional GNAT family N-acetyltransferase/carbon-nitrogen hydrolase family protein [Pseudomonadota bacterium]